MPVPGAALIAPAAERHEVAFGGGMMGDWLLHCRILEHRAAGMMAALRVA